MSPLFVHSGLRPGTVILHKLGQKDVLASADKDVLPWLAVGYVLEHDGEQVLLVNGPSANGQLTLARGFCGTTAKAHPATTWRIASTAFPPSPVERPEAAAKGRSWTCDNCGGPNAEMADQCRWCGH